MISPLACKRGQMLCVAAPQPRRSPGSGELDRQRRAPGAGADNRNWIAIGVRNRLGLCFRLLFLLFQVGLCKQFVKIHRLQQQLRKTAFGYEIRHGFTYIRIEHCRAGSTQQ